jgi:hypothetical protein
MTVAKKKVSRKVKKPLTLRQVLNVIDTVLAKGDSTSTSLWDVLTGLRGPDNNADYSHKDTGTCHVRQIAFPKAAERAGSTYGYLHGAQYSTYAGIQVPTDSGHFQDHLRQAMSALGVLRLINES